MEPNCVTSYKIVSKGGSGEIVEKKSRFIATIAPAETEEEAVSFIEAIRKKYYDARHNCYAYIIGRKSELERGSDDGEPGGTAGRPMLEVLRGLELTNTVAVVTRYFGGTLLGTGGLVRAYTQSLQEGLKSCETVTMRYGFRYAVTAEYTLVGKIQYILGKLSITTEQVNYTDLAEFIIVLPCELEDRMKKEITEATSGKAKIEKSGSIYFVDKADSV